MTFDTFCRHVPRLPRKTPFPHPLKRTKKTSFAVFPIGPGTPPHNHSIKTRTRRKLKTSISYETSSTFHTLYLKNGRFPTSFLMKRKICHVKIDVSCEASVNFQHLSKTATLSTNLRLFTSWRSPDNAISTRLKCCACHAKWRACHEKCNASSENVAKVLLVPHKTTFDSSWNMLECHEVPRLPREMKLRNAGKLQK